MKCAVSHLNIVAVNVSMQCINQLLNLLNLCIIHLIIYSQQQHHSHNHKHHILLALYQISAPALLWQIRNLAIFRKSGRVQLRPNF